MRFPRMKVLLMARGVYNNCNKLKTWFACAQYHAVCINIIYSNLAPVNSSYLCYDYVLVGIYYILSLS